LNEQRLATLSIVATALLVCVTIAFVTMVRPAEAVEFTSKPDYAFEVDPNDVTNNRALEEMRLEKLRQLHDKLVEKYEQRLAEEEAARLAEEQAAWEAEQAYYAQSYYAPSYGGGGIYVAEYSDAYNTDGPSRSMPGWYDGYLETYYDASRHYLASTWTVDSEGFYHDENGRYVIGVDVSHIDEMPYGTVVETGKGEAVVYDYGSGAEVHDFAVAGAPNN
jgi:hypothetical protein